MTTSIHVISEANYAHQKRKPMVFLNLQKGYKPEGWLGLLVGSQKYIEVSNKEAVGEKWREMEEELCERGVTSPTG